MRVYSLTPLTRSANLQRRVVIQGFDVPLRGLTVAGLAAIPGLILTAVVWSLVGSYAILAFALVEGAAFWLVESRTRSGLQLRQYQRFMDMRRNQTGQFLLCGETIHPHQHQFGYVVASSMPGRPLDPRRIFPEPDTRPQSRRMVKSEYTRKDS
jgi:hypothetical protein